MYLLNRGHILKYNENININGIIINSSCLSMPEAERRNLPKVPMLLFDPQLYFPIENNDKIQKTFCKLSTYPWYNDNPPEFHSTEISINDFKKGLIGIKSNYDISLPTDEDEISDRIKSCIEFQNSINVTHLLLPVPLVVDAEDQYTTQLTWINNGIEIAKDYRKPILVTVSISEEVIIHKKFEDNSILQVILDNLMALDDIDGYYITISRSSSNSNITEKNIVQTVLEFSYILGFKNKKKVFFNFIDNLGFLALATGAYAFGSGYYNKEKRLNFNDYIDKDSGGAPLPHFYSYNLIGDFFPERDLGKIRDARLLKYLDGDWTDFSNSLLDFLKNKKDISTLATWKESLNNITTAKDHRMLLMKNKVEYVNSLDFNDKLDYTLNWLQNAEAAKHYFDNLFEDDPLSEDCRHVPVWRKCFEQFIEKYKLL